jgi:hypothetical protein
VPWQKYELCDSTIDYFKVIRHKPYTHYVGHKV